MFTLKHQDDKTNARTGVLKTASGSIATPFFMPVATKMTVKQISPFELTEMGVEAIIANAYILYLKPGTKRIMEAGGIHKFMRYDGNIFTDSGGFQMLSKSFLVAVNDQGIRFRDPFSERQHFLTPEAAIKVQHEIGSDVAMALDHVPPVLQERAHIADAVERTHLWAARCKTYHESCDGKNAYGRKQLLFGITQGGIFDDLREKSAQHINALDFDGIAIGGHCIGEPKEKMHSSIKKQVRYFDESKPRYLMGVGSPVDIIESVALGIDCFDSIYPTKHARHAHVFSRQGMLKIDKGRFANDFAPLDSSCTCYVCKNFTRAFLHHLSRVEDYTYTRYLSYHNVFWLTQFMKEIRNAIKNNEFPQYKKEFMKEF
ncbi:tRNA guanosine(34) transglycosylase Tgt, partial [Candidatus Woesearchaeota archaeon]|nr:tRNA guanosine(34) transglycosylase Tgt [Candidatus Woesearchaeota archaeon]